MSEDEAWIGVALFGECGIKCPKNSPDVAYFQSSQYNKVEWVLNYVRKSIFNSQLCCEFSLPQRSCLSPLCCTCFKYKWNREFLPSLLNFTRMLGGMRNNVWVKTLSESIDHPGPSDTYLLNELLSWFPNFINTWLLVNLPTHWLHHALLIDSREPHQRKKLIDIMAWRKPHSPVNVPNVSLSGQQEKDALFRMLCGVESAWTRIPVSQLIWQRGFAPTLSL